MKFYFLYQKFYNLVLWVAENTFYLSKGKWRSTLTEHLHSEVRWNRDSKQFPQSPLWIHASSGEIEYARPLIRKIRAEFPHKQILVTFSSPSIKNSLSKMHDVDAWTILPWDVEKKIDDFLEFWKPQILLIAKTDLWLTLLTQCEKKNIKRVLFSAPFPENSQKWKGISLYFYREVLSKLNFIYCISKEDQQTLQKAHIKGPKIEVLGDTRYDQVIHRLQNPKPLKKQLKPQLPTLILGSTWPEDEEMFLPLIPSMIDLGFQVVLAPHEIHPFHLHRLLKQLESQKVHTVLYSEGTDSKWDVLLVDQVGILAEIYTWGQMAFVGGSFKKQVHSVMEPLAAGLPTLVGPHHTNNREALYFKKKSLSIGFKNIDCKSKESLSENLKELDLRKKISASQDFINPVTVAKNKEEILQWCLQMKSFPKESLQKKISDEIKIHCGATDKLFLKLKSFLSDEN